VITATLPYGDYTIKGFEDRFSIERKQMSDFYTYIGKEHDRTGKKMEQFREMVSRGVGGIGGGSNRGGHSHRVPDEQGIPGDCPAGPGIL